MDKETIKGIIAIIGLLAANWIGTFLEMHLPPF